MITFSNKYRSTQREIMDDYNFQGNEMKNLLKDLKFVNKWLGGNKITINGLELLLKNNSKKETITILDIGCGDGEMLRKCAKFGVKNNFNLKCIGIDFNENIIETAENLSNNYNNITFITVDIFKEKEKIPTCDIALCTLFLHHFSNKKIEDLIKILTEKTRIGLIINDLHRSKIAFNLFKIFSNLFLKTKTAKHDGLVSIARGFKYNGLIGISNSIPKQQTTIHWRWAFRYQWIIKNTN